MGPFSFAKEKPQNVLFFYSALEILGSWLWPCSPLNGRKEGKGGHWQVSHVEKPHASRGPSPIFCLSFPIYFVSICLIFSASCPGIVPGPYLLGAFGVVSSVSQGKRPVLFLWHPFHSWKRAKAVTCPEVGLWSSSCCGGVRVKCE